MRAKSKTKIHVVEVSSASWRSAQGKAELTREALEVFTPPRRASKPRNCGPDALQLNCGPNGRGRSRAFQ